MRIVIFGSGPMPCEPGYPVMAPGARTWQILQTVAAACGGTAPPPDIVVCGLEGERRADAAASIPMTIPLDGGNHFPFSYLPSEYTEFVRMAENARRRLPPFDQPVQAVIGCASLQPCATAAETATALEAPLWEDIFGDAFSELQSRAGLHPEQVEANDTRYHHIWRLFLKVLLAGDRFSALSERQRHSVIGQLGVAGRLNRLTSGDDIVATIPFAYFPGDLPELYDADAGPEFTVMWCGSFNTWIDVESLLEGVRLAVTDNPELRLLVVGGKITGYNEAAYWKFRNGIHELGLDKSVQLLDWQPLSEIRKLYSLCEVGLSIDRFTYEAVLGSRTRIMGFLAAGKPVISTVVTELTEELAEHGFVIPFRLNDPASLAGAIAEAAARKEELRAVGRRGRDFIATRFNAATAGATLAEWVRNPRFARDHDPAERKANPLIAFWQRIQEQP